MFIVIWGLPVIGVVFCSVVATLRVSAKVAKGLDARAPIWTTWNWCRTPNFRQSMKIWTWINSTAFLLPISCRHTTPNRNRYVFLSLSLSLSLYLRQTSLTLTKKITVATTHFTHILLSLQPVNTRYLFSACSLVNVVVIVKERKIRWMMENENYHCGMKVKCEHWILERPNTRYYKVL